MAGEEDTELRDLVAQTLETKGVLGKIRAQLRAQVFLALEEQESTENRNSLVNEELSSFTNTRQGRLVSGLIREFLEFFGLSATLSVFDPETNAGTSYGGRASLARELDIVDEDEPKCPLLTDVIKAKKPSQKTSKQGVAMELCSQQVNDAKEKFALYDKDCNGLIDKFEVQQLFCDVLPNFPMSMLDSYVNDEFRAASKGVSGAIDFNEFLDMYRRLFTLCRSVATESVTAHITSDIPLTRPSLPLSSRVGDGQSGPDKKLAVNLAADYMAPSKGSNLLAADADALSMSSHSSIHSGYSERSQRMRGVGKEDGFDDLKSGHQQGLEFEHQLGDGGSDDDDLTAVTSNVKQGSASQPELFPRSSLPPLSGAGGGKSSLPTLRNAPPLSGKTHGSILTATDFRLSLGDDMKGLADINSRLNQLGINSGDDLHLGEADQQNYEDDFHSTTSHHTVPSSIPESVESEVAPGSEASSLLNENLDDFLLTEDHSLSHISNGDFDYMESITSN